MKRQLTRLVVVAMVAALAACGSSDGDSSGSGGDAELGTGTIGVLQSTAQSEVIQRWSTTATDSLEAIGWKADVADGKGDPAAMAAAMQGFIAKKVDGIVVIAIDAPAITTQIQDAKSAGIPVISAPLSTSGAGADLFDARYAPDDEEFGRVLADYLKDKLDSGAEYGVLDITAVTGAHGAVEGAEPALDAAGFKNVATVDLNPADIVKEAQNGAVNLLQGNPDMKLLLSCCDFTPAITQAAIGADHPDVIQAARYDNPSSLDIIRQGGNLVLATANADTAVLIALDQILAHKVNGADIDPDAANDAFDFSIVDKDNVPESGYVNDPKPQIDEYVKKWKSEYQAG